MKNLSISIATILLSCSANAAAPLNLNTSWNTVFGGEGMDSFSDVISTPDGGSIVAGSIYSSEGDIDAEQRKSRQDAIIVKYDPLGNVEWQKIYGGSGDERFLSLDQLADGTYVVAGLSNSYDGDLDNDNLDQKDTGVVVGFDIEGNILWSANDYSSVNGYENYIINATSDGGFAVSGISVNGDSFIFLKKYDVTRSVEWEVNYPKTQIFSLESMIATNDDGFALSGSVFGADLDGVLLKTDATGAVIWDYTYSTLSLDEFFEVIQTTEGSFVVTGVEGGTTAYPERPHVPFAAKVDANGNQVWRTNFSSTGLPAGDFTNDYTNVVELDTGELAFAGHAYSFVINPDEELGVSDGLLAILDKDGNELSQQIFGGTSFDMFDSIEQTTDGSILAAGYTEGTSGDITDIVNGDRDGLLVKFASPQQ